jgi:hypothetical protein
MVMMFNVEQSQIVDVRHLGKPGACGHAVELTVRRGLRRRDLVRMILPIAVASLLVLPVGQTKEP